MYKLKPIMRCGMDKKPLMPYSPNSYRNRLPILDIKRLYKNTSTLELGHKRFYIKNKFIIRFNNLSRFKSFSKDTYGHFGKNIPISNTGILSELTKWHHK